MAGYQEDYKSPPGPPTSHGHRPAYGEDRYAPPAGPPPGSRPGPYPAGSTDWTPPPGPPSGRRPGYVVDDFAPPPGPPPCHHSASNDYAPPPGPPPPHRPRVEDDYAPPPGPPPRHLGTSPGSGARTGDYAPPLGRPPGPHHDWQSAVPDTSLFPPPPDLFSGFDKSPTNNATEDQAEAGERWCARYPLTPPMRELDPAVLGAVYHHNIRLIPPKGFSGSLKWAGPGRWRGRAEPRSPDACIISYPPLYAVAAHSPLRHHNQQQGQPPAATIGGKKTSTTVYYEVIILPDSRPEETSLALGFAALPYPGFRLPGWHRGSLAVHGDDGHRYVNDRWGGRSFTAPIRRGETVGIGMTFTATATAALRVDVFFTRQGREEGRWDLHEETDAAEKMPVTGLEGFHDLSCAIGTFDLVSFEGVFDPDRWMYRGVVDGV